MIYGILFVFVFCFVLIDLEVGLSTPSDFRVFSRMYNQTAGDVDTPRSDSPVIFVLSDKLKKIHPYVDSYNMYSQPDWRASTKGEFRLKLSCEATTCSGVKARWEGGESTRDRGLTSTSPPGPPTSRKTNWPAVSVTVFW